MRGNLVKVPYVLLHSGEVERWKLHTKGNLAKVPYVFLLCER